MNKKETINSKKFRKQNYDEENEFFENTKKKQDKDLPWWVELLFVQIGLPEKILIKILKTKKKLMNLLKMIKNP